MKDIEGIVFLILGGYVAARHNEETHFLWEEA